MVHSDVEVMLPTAEIANEGRPYVGHQGVRDYFKDIAEIWEELRVIPQLLAVRDDVVVVIGRAYARGVDGNHGYAGRLGRPPGGWANAFAARLLEPPAGARGGRRLRKRPAPPLIRCYLRRRLPVSLCLIPRTVHLATAFSCESPTA